MAERTPAELAEKVRLAYRAVPEAMPEYDAALSELVSRVEAAERDAAAVRKKMEHNAANLNFCIEERDRYRDALEIIEVGDSGHSGRLARRVLNGETAVPR